MSERDLELLILALWFLGAYQMFVFASAVVTPTRDEALRKMPRARKLPTLLIEGVVTLWLVLFVTCWPAIMVLSIIAKSTQLVIRLARAQQAIARLARQSGRNRELIEHLQRANVNNADIARAVEIIDTSDPFKRRL
jgi:hypothetical protein